MKFGVLLRRSCSLVLALSVVCGLHTETFAANSYNDMDYITSHVSLKVPSGLYISRPEGKITTSADSYFITGGSNPQASLSMNGKAVQTRGERGSFGVFVSLDQGKNVFTFRQGDQQETVTIIRGSTAGSTATTKVISSMAPTYDCATYSGETMTLSCVAPSGASVTATVGGKKVQLKQQAATAVEGVPATFSAKIEAWDVSGTKNLGPVVYTLNGKTQYESAGSVFLTGRNDKLAVQVKNTAAVIYKDANRSAFIETAKLGGIDTVSDISGSLYELSTGGWISKEAVQPLTSSGALTLNVSETIYGRTSDGKGEVYSFPGEARPMFRAYQDTDTFYVTLFRTSFSADAAAQLQSYMQGSEVFSGVKVTSEGSSTQLAFTIAGDMWGYDITYGKNGGVNIFAKNAPQVTSGSQPLSGFTIAVDAGHGGSDPGAIGVPGTDGAMEKDITLATAIAVQKRLESLGAQVMMTRSDDSNPSINERMDATTDADLYISLHCNSIGYTQDANKPQGTEVYYYESRSAALAQALSANVSGYTGRTNRGAKFSNYRVTLNSYAPAVLVEMGFLTNPVEYDDMSSKTGIFRTANAVGDSILAVFG